MSISSENKFPRIIMPILKDVGDASAKVLYDTGGTLNTCSLVYHQFIREQLLVAVVKYKNFNGNNPLDPIKLAGALLDPDTQL